MTITAPSAGQVVKETVTVTFNIDPPAGETITTTQISIDGGTWTDVTNPPTSGGNWDDGSHTWDTLTYPNGSHTIQVRAQDSHGRWGYSEIRLVVVQNEVKVTVTFPDPGSVVNGTVTVTFSIDPPVGETITATQISIDGGTWVDVTNLPTSGGNWDDGSHAWDTTASADGTHTFIIRACDSTGHWGYSLARAVIVDNTPPVISGVMVHYPHGKSTVVTGDTVLITAKIYDSPAGVDPATVVADTSDVDGTTHLMVDDGTDGDAVAGDGVYTCKVVVKSTKDAVLSFTVAASDTLGNAAQPVKGYVDLRNRTRASGGGCSLMTGGRLPPRDFFGWLLPFMFLILLMTAQRWQKPLTKALLRIARFSAVPIAAASLLLVFLIPPAFAQQSPPQQETSLDEIFSSPLLTKNNDFLHALLLVPPLESAVTVPKNALLLRLGSNYAHMKFADSNGTSYIDTKVAFGESYFYLAYGLTPKLELRGLLLYGGWDGSMVFVKDGQSVFDASEVGDGIQSVRLGLKYHFYHCRRYALDIAGVFYLKLPNGSRGDYLTTGGTDTSLGFLLEKRFKKVSFFTNVSFTIVGHQKVFRSDADLNLKNTLSFGIGSSFDIVKWFKLLAQIQGYTNAIDVKVEGCASMPVSLLLGSRFKLDKNLFIEMGIGFGLTADASDLALHIAATLIRF